MKFSLSQSGRLEVPLSVYLLTVVITNFIRLSKRLRLFLCSTVDMLYNFVKYHTVRSKIYNSTQGNIAQFV